MWKQSARIYYQGKDHKAICANGNSSKLKELTTAVYKNGFIFNYIFGESMFTHNSYIALINEKTGLEERYGRVLVIDDGFLKVSGGDISYSKNCSDWMSTGSAFSKSINALFETIGNKIFALFSDGVVECYDYKKNEIYQISLDIKPVAFNSATDDLSNNSNNFICTSWNTTGNTEKKFCLVDESLNVSYLEFPNDITYGENRVFRHPPIYAYKDRLYYIKETQIVNESNKSKVFVSIYLTYININGIEKNVGRIRYYERSGFLNYSAEIAHTAFIENGAIIVYGNLVITLSDDGNSMSISNSTFRVFDIAVYSNNKTVGTIKFEINRFSNIHLYVENGERKKNGFIYTYAVYDASSGKYQIYICLVRDLFKSDRNMAIRCT